MPALSDKERLDWLQLIRTPSIGPITFHRLLARYGTAAKALAALPDLARKAGGRTPPRPPDRREIEDELADADRAGARAIASCEDDYPAPLAAIPDRPPVLYVRGHRHLFDKPAVAMIGARNASGVGRKIARQLAAELGAQGYIIVSGLARGIDGAAHEASIASGTIAVVAGGVDVIYPPEHADLTERIAREGAVVSECPMGYQPTGRDFPKRNRLISGLARGVVVVEAAARSGTLITARYALEQGREVFAVPGSPLDPRCRGANKLIQDGAKLVQDAQDILDELTQPYRAVWEDPRDTEWTANMDDAEPDAARMASIRKQVLELLGYTPLHRDELLRELDAGPGLVADALLELVLAGDALELPGGRFCLNSD